MANGNYDRGGYSTMSRAEKFEDEKKRIIESCFSKKEEDGAYAESYITHIRIFEDSMFPSSPPPPDSAPHHKKPRVIIVAVRRSGRVRMHKARENTNGTFSIGKTWVLDHLNSIESYTGSTPTTEEEGQRKEWAGDVGFLITIQKPYFWQAITAKEKDFFIGSLVKIFRKYTGGQEPLLSGFTAAELAEFTAPPPQAMQPGQANGTAPLNPQKTSSQRHAPLPVPGLNPSSSGYPGAPTQDVRPGSSREDRSQVSGDFRTQKADIFDSSVVISEHSQDGSKIDLDHGSRRMESQPGSRSHSQDPRRNSPATSTNSFETRGPATPRGSKDPPVGSLDSFHGRRELQDRPSINAAPEHRQVNGSHSPLLQARTPPVPPVPGPRSPERYEQRELKARPSASPTRLTELPERRRPPLPNAGSGRRDLSSPPSQSNLTSSDKQNPRVVADTSQLSTENLSDVGSSQKQTLNNLYIPTKPEQAIDRQESRLLETRHAPSTGNVSDIAAALSLDSSVDSPRLQSESQAESPTTEENHRPGLGPMIKKKSTKDLANTMWKVAAAHSAFIPRVGGAAEKLRDQEPKSPGSSDGINGVFIPSVARDVPKSPLQTMHGTFDGAFDGTVLTTSLLPEENRTPTPDNVKENLSRESTDAVKVMPRGPMPPVIIEPAQGISKVEEAKSPAAVVRSEQSPISQEAQHGSEFPNHAVDYAKIIGINPILLEGRTLELEAVLDDFGWGEEGKPNRSVEDLQLDLRKDLAKLEMGSWLSAFEENDERVSVVSKLIDKTIAECDELEGLLTLYNVELGTLSEDIAYIEAQSQGLQVQTANQRLLQMELQSLLDTVTIPEPQLLVLKEASLTKVEGLQAAEATLGQLYKAMLMIEPNKSLPARAETSLGDFGSGISSMRAVQEKRTSYQQQAITFIQRFKQYMAIKFGEAETHARPAVEQDRLFSDASAKMDPRWRDQARASLWMYSPLMLFARDIVVSDWAEMLGMYENCIKSPYQTHLRNGISAWKRVAKRPTGEEQEALFTTQEKESDGLVGRKLTVKRSKTLREGPRGSGGEKGQEGKKPAYEVFTGALDDMTRAIFVEQNFMVEMFHISSSGTAEFSDLVTASGPEQRRGPDLKGKRPPELGGPWTPRIMEAMNNVFSYWRQDVQGLIDWVLSQDVLQGIGVLFAIEFNCLQFTSTNQEFLLETLHRLRGDLEQRYARFVDEQIRAIDATKVKISKRKGVIPFMKAFPIFALSVETMLPSPVADSSEIRRKVNGDYDKIHKAMFGALDILGRKDQETVGETEEKEVLNYHILLIENHNHYVEEVDVRSNPVLRGWKQESQEIMDKHMGDYLGAVISRPLGPLIQAIESAEAAAASGPTSVAALASRSHQAASFKKSISEYDAKDVRKGIEALKKRVEKHFGEVEDGPSPRKHLVQKVHNACEARYLNIYERLMIIATNVYEGQIEVEFKREDITSAFRR